MATGKTNAGGGGGTSLNFDVKAYATEATLLADTPKENAIGVITSTAIPGWYFTATQPENMENGDVWFQVGTESTIQFNALKKNGIQVYPISVKQYVNGVWVNKGAKIYQDGEWKDVLSYDWSATELSEFWTTGSSGLTVASEAKGLRITRNGTYGVCNSDISFDVTNWDYLHVTFSEGSYNASYGNGVVQIGVRDITGDGNFLAYKNATTGQVSGTLSVSLNGLKSYKKLYVGLSITGGQVASALIERIWFE